MSNNISRKGLAWGALVAVAASLFAGVPAHAAAGVTLAANSSSQVLAVPTGTSFQLVETASSEIPNTSYNTLAVDVKPLDAGNALVTIDGRVTGAVRSTDTHVTFSAATINSSRNNVTVEVRGTDSATHSYLVTTWLDADGSNTVNNGEYSASQTITFYGAAQLTATTTFIKSPSYTSDSRTVQVRTTLDNVNTDQMKLASNGDTGFNIAASVLTIDLRGGTGDTRYDARQVTTENSGNGVAVLASTDARAFYAKQVANGVGGPYTSGLAGVEITSDARVWAAGSYYTAQAYWKGTAIGNLASSNGLVNGIANGIAIATVVDQNALASTSGSARTDNQSANVRLNNNYQVKITVTADTKAAIANQDVVFTVGSSFVTASARLTINGTEYATSSSVRTVAARTDASGVAILNLGVTGFGVHTTGDSTSDLVISAKVNNVTSPNLTLFQTKAVADVANASFTPAEQGVVLGNNASVVVTLNDQFGKAWAGDYTAQAYFYDATVAGGTALTATNKYAALTNGSATVAFGADANVTGDSRWTIQLRANDTVNGGYTGSATEIGTAKVAFRTAAQLAAGNILSDVANTTNGVRTSAARNVAAVALTKAGYLAATTAGQIEGWAVVTTGRAVSYASVTVAGKGLLFTDGTQYVADSITVQADVNGHFTVGYISNTTGANAVTVSAGSASFSTTVAINAPAVNSGTQFGTTLAPATALLAGTAAVVTFSVRDVYGNQLTAPATLSVHVSGDITRDITYSSQSVDAKGFFTVGDTLGKTGTAFYTVTYSSDTRVVTSQVRVDWAKASVTVSVPDTATAGQNTDVVVTVLDPAGNGLAGYEVSASSTGVGYLTVAKATTDANGSAVVKLFANGDELGWAYVTATTTINLVASTSDAAGFQVVAPEVIPTATDSVATLTLAVPASAQAGTVVDVVATATDADGNPVAGADVSATSTGVGYLAIAKGTTDDNGQLVLKLVVGAGENGTASVTATSGSATADAAEVTAGVTDANITIAKKRVTVDWAFAANKKVVIVRDGVAIKSLVASSNAAGSYSFNLKSGTHKVSVKVGGVTIDSQSYKIK